MHWTVIDLHVDMQLIILKYSTCHDWHTSTKKKWKFTPFTNNINHRKMSTLKTQGCNILTHLRLQSIHLPTTSKDDLCSHLLIELYSLIGMPTKEESCRIHLPRACILRKIPILILNFCAHLALSSVDLSSNHQCPSLSGWLHSPVNKYVSLKWMLPWDALAAKVTSIHTSNSMEPVAQLPAIYADYASRLTKLSIKSISQALR